MLQFVHQQQAYRQTSCISMFTRSRRGELIKSPLPHRSLSHSATGTKPSSPKTSALHRRLTGEFADLLANPTPGITAQPRTDDITTWTATITGPEHSPYAGGRFNLTIHFPSTYPFKPPVVRFITKVYHPNINPDTGAIGLKALDDEWTAIVTTAAMLLSVQAFLAAPVLSQNPRSALMPDIARDFQTDRERYVRTAEE